MHKITTKHKGRKQFVSVRVDNTLAYTLKQHKQAIKAIRHKARVDIKQHRLLIKQAKISYKLSK